MQNNSGLIGNSVKALAIDSLGTIWLSTGGGLMSYDGSNWAQYSSVNPYVPANQSIIHILIDDDGVKWLSCFFGLVRFDGNTWIVYDYKNSGILQGATRTLAIDSMDRKWICTSIGLSVFDEGYQTKPFVSTSPVTAITIFSALCGGSILHDGGDSILSQGVVWDTVPGVNVNQYLGSVSNTPGNAAFVSFITGLQENTSYYVRAFATNGQGTGYGKEFGFSTLLSGIHEIESIRLELYPNPVLSELYIELGTGLHCVSVLDLSGKLILTSIHHGETKTVVNVSGLTTGTYVVVMEDLSGNVFIRKMLCAN